MAAGTSELLGQRAIPVLCIAIIVFAASAFAQGGDRAAAELRQRAEAEKKPVDVLGVGEKLTRVGTPPDAVTALDRPIDPTVYVLGPGDVLGVNLRGGVGTFYLAEVTPEGKLLVPQLPMLQVGGLTLAAALDTIAARWSRRIEDAPVDAALIRMRQMRVSVGGAVVNPGQYVVTPADRALTLIELAGGRTEDASDRHATLRRAGGRSEQVDQLRYLRSGALDANPRLTAGAHLVVEPESDEFAEIEVGGGVRLPGTYEWLPDDRVIDAIELAGGMRATASADTVFLTRFVQGSPRTSEVVLSELPDGGRGPELEPGDLVYVRFDLAKTPPRATVLVKGEVHYPGRYPIAIGKTRVLEVFEQAGGITELGSERGARLYRVRSPNEWRAKEVDRLDTTDVVLLNRADEQFHREYLRTLQRDYLPVDFRKLLHGTERERRENNVVLHDSLVIDVPREVHDVLIIGSVKSPGYYRYRENWSYDDYIEQAGGYLKEADERQARHMPWLSGQVVLARNEFEILPGDILFVPEKFVPAFWDLFREYFSVFLQAATLAMLIVNVT